MAAAQPLTLDFATVDVFTATKFAGNPLGVVLVPASKRHLLDQAKKQLIAREFNLSETVFLHLGDDGSDSPAHDLDIFTIESELPFAGHPTIGSAFYLVNHVNPRATTLNIKAGPIQFTQKEDSTVLAHIPHDVHVHGQTLGGRLESDACTAEIKSVIESGLSDDAELRQAELVAPVVSIVKGMTFVLVQLPNVEALGRVTGAKRLDFDKAVGLLDPGAWEKSFVARYYYVLLGDGSRGGAAWEIRTRMMELGFEDPATGSAACALASDLTLKMGAGQQFSITQGVEMGRKSDIVVETTTKEEAGEIKIADVCLGGTAVVVMKGSISV